MRVQEVTLEDVRMPMLYVTDIKHLTIRSLSKFIDLRGIMYTHMNRYCIYLYKSIILYVHLMQVLFLSVLV